MTQSNKHLQRTRHERASLVSSVGEPLKRSIGRHLLVVKEMGKDKPHRAQRYRELADHAAVVKKVDDRIVGFAESERQGITTSSDQQPDGKVSLRLSGYSPQGEEDSFNASRILTEAMNRMGASWSEPTAGVELADYVAIDLRQPSLTLEIQVVRAIEDPIFWKSLNKTGEVQRVKPPIDLVPMVRAAVAKKVIRYGPAERARLVLALDANRLPDLTLDDVVNHIRTELKDWLASLGFLEIWLVGPMWDLTYRLYP